MKYTCTFESQDTDLEIIKARLTEFIEECHFQSHLCGLNEGDIVFADIYDINVGNSIVLFRRRGIIEVAVHARHYHTTSLNIEIEFDDKKCVALHTFMTFLCYHYDATWDIVRKAKASKVKG